MKLYCKWFFGKCQCTVAAYETFRAPEQALARAHGKFPTFGHLLDTPVDVRVPAAAKFDPERRPFQAKHPAEIGLEITAVAFRHGAVRTPPPHVGLWGCSLRLTLTQLSAL